MTKKEAQSIGPVTPEEILHRFELAKDEDYEFGRAAEALLVCRLLASGSMDQTVRIWKVADRSHLETLTGHEDSVTSVAFSPAAGILASGSNDGTVRVWGAD